jgi:hypothetical protein
MRDVIRAADVTKGEVVLTRRADATSTTCSSARRATCLVAVRRVVLLGAFLLGGFAIAASWSAAASATEDAADLPAAAHNRLLDLVTAAVDTAQKTVATTSVADSDQRPTTAPVYVLLRPVADVDRATGLSQVTRAVAVNVGVVAGDGLAEVLRGTATDVDTAIDAIVTDQEVVPETPSLDVPSRPDTAVGTTKPPTEAAPTTVARNPHGVAAPAGSAAPTPAATGASVRRDSGSPYDFPTGFPVLPFAAAGTGAGTSSAGSSGGPTSGVVLPGRDSRDDAFIAEIAPDSVYPLRHRADDPEVSPA